MDEYSSEQQFHKLPLLCEKSGTILLLLVGPTAGSPGRQSEEILVDLKFLKFSMDWIVRIFTGFNEGKVLLYAFQSAFRVKCILRHVIKARKSGMSCFSC